MAPKRRATTAPLASSSSSAPKRARRATNTAPRAPRKTKTPLSKRQGWPKTEAERELYGFREPDTYSSDSDVDVDLDTPELVHSRPYEGKKTYRTRLAEGLPPIHDLDEMFRLITSRALELGLGEALEHLGRRPLRVATVCSGTESPLLALEMVKSREFFFSFSPAMLWFRGGGRVGSL